MFRQPLTIILAFVLTVAAVIGWFYHQESQRLKVELPNARWEPIFFRLINKTTELGRLGELRKANLNERDIEIRVWRGFGLGDLEGVILKCTGDRWAALHVKADDYVEPQHVEVQELNPPKSGWDSFWKNITEQGLLTLRDPSEKGCEDDGIDGTSYVVEIYHNNSYRTYRIREGGKCKGVRQMETIDDLIGGEFDSGQEQCQEAEWFACAKLRKSYRQNSYENPETNSASNNSADGQ